MELKIGTAAVSARSVAQGIDVGLADGSLVRGSHLLVAVGQSPSFGPNAAEWANQWVTHLGRRMTSPITLPTIYPTMGSINAVLGYMWADRKARTTLLGRLARTLVRWWMSRPTSREEAFLDRRRNRPPV